MEHAHAIDRPFSWRGAALALTLLLVIALAGLGGMALVDHMGRAAPPGKSSPAQSHRAVPLRPRSAASVLVLNGNGVDGAAGAETSRLLARGYRAAFAADAPNHDYATSLVLYRRGWAGEAARLARDAGIRTVAPLDGHVPGAYASYRLVLVLGR